MTKNKFEAEILAAMNSHFEARRQGDTKAILQTYSDDWTDSKGFTKSGLKDGHLAFTSGDTAAAVEIDLSQVKIDVDEDQVSFGPVTLITPKGSITYSYTLRKEPDDVWRLIFTRTLDWEPFPIDLQTQARKRQIDATAEKVREHREQLLGDPHRPAYHFVLPEGVAFPFDPNGAIYWKGRYHLFYIYQDKRSGKKSDHWGHVSSTDLFHWRHHPTGLLDGMYSGNCFLNKDGVPTICYHQVDQGNAMAVALDDELNEWQKLESNPITPETRPGDPHHGKYRSWDPFGWHENGRYYAIFGGEHPAVARSDELAGQWKYRGDLFAHGVDGVSLNEDVSCAELFRLGNKDMLLCISHRLGCRYYLGQWKNEQFHPESHAQMSWVDNSFFAPESLLDDRGRRIMWAWILDNETFGARLDGGWSGTLSLPRLLWLDEEGGLKMDVVPEIESLRYRPVQLDGFELAAGKDQLLEGISGNCMELAIDLLSEGADEIGVIVCASADRQEQTVISYHAGEEQLKIDTRRSGPPGTPKNIESAPLKLLPGEALRLRVFIDKSVVEVFANERQALMRRIYPSGPDSTGVRLFSKGGRTRVCKLESWQVSPANPY